MKYAQLIIGLLAGTAIGGSVVASTGIAPTTGAAMDTESVKKIVREVIADEPKLIIESVQKFQVAEQQKQQAGLSDVLKDAAVREEVFNGPNIATTGPKDSKHVMVEFFDYNCGACKGMFKSIDTVMKKDPTMRIIFHEYPIFGPVSDTNSKIGIAVNRLYPDKYFDFHTKMITHEGHADQSVALGIAKDLGMDVDKIKAESEKKDVMDVIEANRKLGDKLHIQGTPTIVIGDEIIPHGMSAEELEARLNAAGGTKAPEAPAADAQKADAPKVEPTKPE